MSSLLQTASPWTNDNSTTLKKRISTMKNTLKKVQPGQSGGDTSDGATGSAPIMNEYYYMQDAAAGRENFENSMSGSAQAPATIEQSQQVMDSRTSTINNLLNSVGVASGDNAGSNLVNFRPPQTTAAAAPQPMQFNPPPAGILTKSSGSGMSAIKPVDLFPKGSETFSAGGGTPSGGGATYSQSSASYGGTNYNTVYTAPITDLQNTPYYAKMGIGAGAAGDDKLMERLNYMIHLLEQQQNEKTTNVVEEIILYAMLGVFVIFVVDGFRQSGKYIR
jgi:hypothetical protein